MKKLIIFLMLLSSFSFAQGKSAFLKQGNPAPFDGIILDSQAQAEMIANSEYEKKKCKLDCDYQLLKSKAENDLVVAKMKVDLDIANQKYDIVVKLKDEEIKRINDIAIKESNKNSYTPYWIAGGVLVGIVTSVAIFFSVSYGAK